MAKKRRLLISGIEQFGYGVQTVRRLGERRVTVTITIPPPPYVYPSPATFRWLIQKTPAERVALSKAWRLRKLRQLRNELPPTVSVGIDRSRRMPYGLRVIMRAREVPGLTRLKHAERVEVTRIAGLRARNRGVRADRPRLYAVKGRLVGQHERQRAGFQPYEDRVVVLLAPSERVAAERVARLLQREQSAVLTTSGHYQRDCFDGILDVQECTDLDMRYSATTRFNPRGTEVWSEVGRRRLRPGLEWRPV